jgi:threonyl-tRNA synthetase
LDVITITLPDGSHRSVPPGTPVREFAEAALPAGLLRKALAAVVDGRAVDLTYPLDHDASVRLLLPEGADALALYRHSTAHLLAAAVTQLFPRSRRRCASSPQRICRTAARCGRATRPSRSSTIAASR